MNKFQIRKLKSHYGVRWTAFKYNRKHQQKILPSEEKFVLDNVLPGKVVAYDCLGELYQNILDVSVDLQLCNTIVLINPIRFKYKNTQQLCKEIVSFGKYLLPGGRIIANIDLKSLIYPRLYISIPTLCDQIKEICRSAGFDSNYSLIPLDKSNHGYGQIYLILDKHV